MKNWTVNAIEALQKAQNKAYEASHAELEPVHLLFALLNEPGLATRTLRSLELDPVLIVRTVEKEIASLPQVEQKDVPNPSRELQKVLLEAGDLARQHNSGMVGSAELLRALAGDQGRAGGVLKAFDVDEGTIAHAQEISRRNGSYTNTDGAADEAEQSALDLYAVDLCASARAGKIDPIIGRDEEIRRVIQILSRRTKNNPVLIGDPGVGKTAVAEGLARRLVEGDVPENLKNKRLLALDLGALLAGTKYRGEFEDRLKQIVKQVTESEGEYLLFIDEMHTLVGAGAAEGAMDASNILKPALARGELHCIGATTGGEYRQHIEKDPALERRFQPVLVDEPSSEQAIAILRGLKDKYEVHHGIRITDGAIVAAVNLSERFIADRQLPDKAIDLMDEAASRLRMEIDSVPREVDDLQRRLNQFEMEKLALEKEKDKSAIARRETIDHQISQLREDLVKVQARWEEEKAVIDRIRSVQQEQERLTLEMEEAERLGDLALASELKYSGQKQIENEINAAHDELKFIQGDTPLLKEEVDHDDIAALVASWTGIPAQRLVEEEAVRLRQLEQRLGARVLGQDEAISRVARTIRRNRAGLTDRSRPLGSFLFLGPTGVGKTELVKTIAEQLFGDQSHMVRLDMSEYMERHAVARMIGAPPGYVGHETGGQLTEAVRRHPYTVVLLDEIEKAHPEVMNVLLQLLDDGRLTDGKGRVVNFSNTLVIMTSNLCQEETFEIPSTESEEETRARENRLLETLGGHFRPEFLNRLDSITRFSSLSPELIRKIVELELAKVAELTAEQELCLEATPAAIARLAEQGYTPRFGARPVKRVIQHQVHDRLADLVLAGQTGPEHVVVLDVKGDEFQMRVTGPEETTVGGTGTAKHSRQVS